LTKFLDSKVLIISDIHLGSGSDSPIFHNIAINLSKFIKQEAINNNIKDIIICGDIFNNRHEISVTTIHTAHEFFSNLNMFNIFALVGNHDAYYKDRADVNSINILNGRDNITIINEPIVINQFGKQIAFCPWGSKLDFIKDKVDYLFGHFETKTFKLTKYEDCQIGFTPAELLEKSQTTFSGHLHVRDEREYKDGKIIYVGNPFQLNWGDYELDKGYYILDFKTNDLSFNKNTISPIHIKYNLSKILESGLTNQIKSQFQNNIVKVIIDSKIDQETIELLYNKFLSLKPLDLKFDLIDYDNNVITNDDNIKIDDNIDFNQTLKEYITNNIDFTEKEKVLDYILKIYNNIKESKNI